MSRFEFPYGEGYEHQVIPYARLERDAPSCPGLYSWHFRLPRSNPEKATAFLRSLFNASTLNVSVRGNMRQSWAGSVQANGDAFRDGLSPALASAFFAIAYPLYIGISENLRVRLKAHKSQLDFYKNQIAPLQAGVPEPDTDDESSCFGARLGTVFRAARFYETENLFVKCMSWPPTAVTGPVEGATMEQLRAAEWTCNTLFHPVFGRR